MWKLISLVVTFCLLVSTLAHVTYYDPIDDHYNRPGYISTYNQAPGSYGYGGYRSYGSYPSYRSYRRSSFYPRRRYGRQFGRRGYMAGHY